MSKTIREMELESALRRATGLLRATADMLGEADPIAMMIREDVAAHKALLGDPLEWRNAA